MAASCKYANSSAWYQSITICPTNNRIFATETANVHVLPFRKNYMHVANS